LRETAEDRRTQKTHKALREALASLMFEKNYHSIVIQEILDRANVGRSTFYTHYRDKDELLVAGLQGMRELLSRAQQEAAASATRSYEKVISFSLAMFEHAHDHRKLYRTLSGGPGWTIVRQHIEEMLVKLMKDQARPLFRQRATSEVSFELFVHFLGASFMSVLTWWFNSRVPLAPKEIDALYRDLVIPTLAAHLK